jgi:predicted helicase
MGNRPFLLARHEPRAHQLDAIDAVCAEFQIADRATVVKACGTGKTLLEPEIDARMRARYTLVLAPTLGLLSQTIQTWLRQYPVRLAEALCICSDLTVVPDEPTDELPVNLLMLDCPITRNADDAREVIREAQRGLVVFSTYQSAAVLAQALPEGFRFDLGIFDEAHRTTGLAGKEFSRALDDAAIPIAKRLFMTATPRLVRAGGNGSETIYSMDDETVYGRVAYRLTLREAIRQGQVCDGALASSPIRLNAASYHWMAMRVPIRRTLPHSSPCRKQ